ncbi:DUF2407 C-terminal domain-containing protein [Boeremia exigua]|uniref:DUF2407 C-terminal domain-containing protein n=1 Tax=Boeremia exigua TaxID=749465 RepID=UPI001E8E9B04|nr:DUF2407 C-terminal domain-containing protein [Boeremia exigua]KAH6618513.1 DUF2407 C-terminal domain-containing protein [Boeremia exigua]
MTTVPLLPEQLVYLIIRFSASIPDLSLSIPSPRLTSTLSLKQLIRSHLSPDQATARLRLIYAGKVLTDTAPLSSSLRLPPPPSLRTDKYKEDGSGSKGKGKQPVRDAPAVEYGATAPPEAKKYYIHCSLGDALTAAELNSEATLAQNIETSLKSQYEASQDSASRRRSSSSAQSSATQWRGSSTTTPAPQGFDRLLTSGFTAQEVASLRSHFQTNLSFTHTPDTMPSPAEMRVLEDRWLDSTGTDPSPALTGEADAGWGAGFAVEEGGLDDMLWGYITGFFWPLGALIWGFREDGVWSRRRQLAVVMGVLINAIFGFMRWSA